VLAPVFPHPAPGTHVVPAPAAMADTSGLPAKVADPPVPEKTVPVHRRRCASEALDPEANMKLVEEEFEKAIPSLQDFVRIPNLSIAYDAEWETNGLLDRACEHAASWIKEQGVQGCKVEILKDPGFSPFVIVEIDGTPGSPKASSTFVMYGHLDKQPHGPGWDEDISPTGALIRDDKLYGRGSGDDGYAVYSCVIAVKVLQRQGIDHPRMVIILETSEESGSPHLGHYIEKLAGRIGMPSAVFCMDSVVEDFTTLWMTSSLRGVVSGTLEVGLLKVGMHSGFGGGIVPDAFRVARQLLARVEDPATGKVLLPELSTKIPLERQEQMKATASSIGRPDTHRGFAFLDGAEPQNKDDVYAMYLANLWEPCMTVVGFDGLPPPERAGNVLNPFVKLQVSFRIPPLVDEKKAAQAVEDAFKKDPPYGATVKASFTGHCAAGWNAPDPKPNLEAAISRACKANFDGKEVGYCGVGATIPLMNMLGQMFPDASLVCTGILGPGTNMHGPNECLPIGYTKKVTASIAMTMGLMAPDKPPENWPEGVPLPIVQSPSRSPKKAPRFCFTQPDVPVGMCLCCL